MSDRPPSRDPRLAHALGFGLAAATAILVVMLLHDRSWLAHDEGAYAHVASRILQGEVLNREVQDVHAGHINFVNAAALRLFGDNMLSLRYPLAAMCVLQSCLVYLLLAPRGMLLAVTGAVAMASLSLVQFLNPTANWYALFLGVVIICWLTWRPSGSWLRIETVGLLLATLFLFRQLSGVIMAIGVVTYLLCELPASRRGVSGKLSRCLIVVMAAGLTGYLVVKTGWFAFAAYGFGPLGIMLWLWRREAPEDRQVIKLVGQLAVGAAAGAAPLVGYHLWHGSLSGWLHDTLVAAEALTRLDFIDQVRYWQLAQAGLSQLANAPGLNEKVNGGFWLVLPLLAPLLGALTLVRVKKLEACDAPHPLPFLAVFFATVSLHFQVPMYLFYTVGLTIAGLLWLAPKPKRLAQYAPIAVVSGLCVVGIAFHAGQPVTRGRGVFTGEREQLTRCSLERCGLWITVKDAETYETLVRLVERETQADETILALPVNPELYYLTGRRNPTRFFNSALGLQSDEAVEKLLDELSQRPPRLVFYGAGKWYDTPRTQRVLTFVRDNYERYGMVGEFEVFRQPSREESTNE